MGQEGARSPEEEFEQNVSWWATHKAFAEQQNSGPFPERDFGLLLLGGPGRSQKRGRQKAAPGTSQPAAGQRPGMGWGRESPGPWVWEDPRAT